MPFAVPFAALPYVASLILWSAIGVTIFAATLARLGADWKLIATLVASPAAVFCLISGQSSLITAAMILGAFSLLDRRPLLAGVLIGLLTLKPQLGLLFPVMLVASGRWRVFASATVTALALALATTALFGVDVWRDFVTMGLPVQREVLADPYLVATPFYVTIFMNVRGLDAPFAVAMAAQLVFTLGAVVLTWAAFTRRRDADPALLTALFLAASVAATPYMLSYDSLSLAVAAIALLASGKLEGRGRLLGQLAFWLPLIQITLGALHIPGPALIAPAFGLWVAALIGLVRLPRSMAAQPG
jgi:hypothetical protein